MNFWEDGTQKTQHEIGTFNCFSVDPINAILNKKCMYYKIVAKFHFALVFDTIKNRNLVTLGRFPIEIETQISYIITHSYFYSIEISKVIWGSIQSEIH